MSDTDEVAEERWTNDVYVPYLHVGSLTGEKEPAAPFFAFLDPRTHSYLQLHRGQDVEMLVLPSMYSTTLWGSSEIIGTPNVGEQLPRFLVHVELE